MSGAATEATAKRPAAVVYQRDKKTKASVIFTDAFARYGITIGGMLVILAVFAIMAFLVYVCLPLLNDGDLKGVKSYRIPGAGETLAEVQLDEHITVAAGVGLDGKIDAFHAGTGTALAAPPFDFAGKTATAFAATLRGDDVIFGFGDGTVRVGKFKLRADIVPASQVATNLNKIDSRDSTDGSAVFSSVPGQFRRTSIESTLEAPVQIATADTAILKMDYRVGGTAERPLKTFVTLDATGKLRLSQAYSEMNMMTGESTTQVTNAEMPLDGNPADVFKILLNTLGDRVIVVKRDGTAMRYNTRDFANPKLAERTRVTPEGVEITAVGYLNGENSLVVGGADGSVSIWFGVDRKSKDTIDGIVLTKVHADFAKQSAAITAINVSQRTRLFSTTDAAGNIWIRHGTTERTLLGLPDTPDRSGLSAVAFAPKDDGILGVGKNGAAALWSVNIPHPETTLQSLFGKVWYEGYTEPEYVWQSTASTDAPEPKLSLMPLIFGTFKAAIYSLLLAIPIALFAAIYTSEFVSPRTRSVVKPVMELMATLPSVVIGFVAALVLSPIVENWIAAIVIAFAVVPLTLITMSFVWQILPQSVANALDGVPKLFAYFTAIGAAVWLSQLAGPLVEATFFGGDFKKWTSGEGSGQPFLFLILLPASFALTILFTRPLYNAVYRTNLREMSKFMAALRELIPYDADNFVPWYNLACALALTGQTDEALLELQGVLARGEISVGHVEKDGDAYRVVPVHWSQQL